MRITSVLSGVLLLVVGLGLLAALLYDATDVVTLIGLDPAGNEAIVVVVGLALVALAVGAGVRELRRAFARAPGAKAV